MTPEKILKTYWGYSEFREPQEKIIKALLEHYDVMAILPTGAGKSICFQVPGLIMDGLCLVISPLIALIEDQVKQLRDRNIQAVSIHSGMSSREIDITLDNCVYGKIKFLYVSPERISTKLFQERLKRMKVNLIAIDEAHCISQWGHDFRPSYLELFQLRKIHAHVPMVALTASATKQVRDEIIHFLQLKNLLNFQISFARPNLSFVVRQAENKEEKIIHILKKVQGPAIVYTRSRKRTMNLAQKLTENALTATYYHAGLSYQKRELNQSEWLANKYRIMVATNAFGMGINKANVRVVIHIDMPENVESYYQEAGRAGRDGKRAYAVLIYHPGDQVMLIDHMKKKQITVNTLQQIYRGLSNYYQMALGSGENTSSPFDLEAFCAYVKKPSATVYAALKKLEEEELIQFNQMFHRPSKFHFLMDRSRVYQYQIEHAHFDPIIKTILRLYGGESFHYFIAISEAQIAAGLNSSYETVVNTLKQLHHLRVVSYEESSEKPQIVWIAPRQDANHLPVNQKRISQRNTLYEHKMRSMIDYAVQTVRCRMQVIQDYFDEETFAVCGLCDICLSQKKKKETNQRINYQEQVLVILDMKPMSTDALEREIDPKNHELFIEVIRELIDNDQIFYDHLWVLHLGSKAKKSG